MRFRVGDCVQFSDFFEPGVTDFGVVGRHRYRKSRRLVVRGKMTGFTHCDYELYLTDVCKFSPQKC